MAKKPELYDEIGQSIAPAIYGHRDIKKALACALFAGSQKRLRDGMRIRGDSASLPPSPPLHNPPQQSHHAYPERRLCTHHVSRRRARGSTTKIPRSASRAACCVLRAACCVLRAARLGISGSLARSQRAPAG
eukprot:COSAG06_NODE_2862_length_6156_cov_37.661165_7_plen_133_part_00